MTFLAKKNIFKLNTLLVTVAGLLMLAWILLRIIFPVFRYSGEAIKYTGKPVTFVVPYQLEKRNFLAVSPFLDYNFHSLKLKLIKDSKLGNLPQSIPIWKGYIAQAYPFGTSIKTENELNNFLFNGTESEIPNGSLVEYNGAVYFISEGAACPFVDPGVFNKLGFDWQKVRKISGDQFSKFKKGEAIDYNTPHPSGTIIIVGGDNFLVHEKTLKNILNDDWVDNRNYNFSKIILSRLELEKVGDCQKTISFKKVFSCQLKTDKKTYPIPGDNYLFETTGVFLTGGFQEQFVVLATANKFDFDAIRQSLAVIKNSLYLRYYQYLL